MDERTERLLGQITAALHHNDPRCQPISDFIQGRPFTVIRGTFNSEQLVASLREIFAADAPPPAPTPINTAVIAEFLALASMLEPNSPPADYRRANQLGYQLAMELPADLWRTILYEGIGGGTVEKVWLAVFAARAALDPTGARGDISSRDAFLARPGIGNPGPGTFPET